MCHLQSAMVLLSFSLFLFLVVLTYFNIGKMIVEDEQKGESKAGYSNQTLKKLSINLTRDFGKGFSHRNLEYFRKFYLTDCKRISQSAIAKSQKKNKKRVRGNSSITD